MDVLNTGLDFHRDTDRDVKEAFWGPPCKNLLLPHVSLYRMVTLADPQAGYEGNELFLSPWWYPQETWEELNRMAQRLDRPMAQVARTHLAVRDAWNPQMDWLCVIQLKKPVWCWRGKIRYQQTAPASGIYFLGGLDQVFIPNLARGPRDSLASNASDFAEIITFGRLV
jgi:hypothetical protein